MNKLLITSALVIGFVSSALANAPAPFTVTLSGMNKTQYGITSQGHGHNHLEPDDATSEKLRNHALVNDVEIVVKADAKCAKSGMGYGFKGVIDANTSESKDGNTNVAQQTMGYFQGDFGLFEAGSYTGASHKFKVGGSTIAKGTGGIDGDGRYWVNQHISDGGTGSNPLLKDVVLLTPNLYQNNKSIVGVKGLNAAKISFYTPSMMNGIQGGITYIPDTESYGTINKASSILKFETTSPAQFRDVVEGGLYLSGKSKSFGYKVSVTGQIGDSKSYNDGTPPLIPYRKLKAYGAGAAFTFGHFTVAGSYGDNGKSGLPVGGAPKKSKYFDAGVSYEKGPMGVSVTYFDSKRGVAGATAANTAKVWAAGGNYRAATGLDFHFDVYNIDAKNKNGGPATRSMNSTVFLLGTTLLF